VGYLGDDASFDGEFPDFAPSLEVLGADSPTLLLLDPALSEGDFSEARCSACAASRFCFAASMP
jgi:hypothetical protein